MPSRLYTMGLVGLALAGIWRQGNPLAASVDWVGLLAFAAAVTLLALFDVWLPYGDAADMSGPLIFSLALLLGVLPATVVVVLSRVVAAVANRHERGPIALVEDVARRLAVLAWTAWFFGASGGTTASLNAPGPVTYLRVLMAAVLFFGADSILTQLGASLRLSSSFTALLTGNMRLLGWIGVAQVSVGVLSSLIFGAMGGWGLLIVSGLLLVMRQSFALLVDVKRAYRSTVEVLARALEAHDPERRGHAERVAALTTAAGRILGIHGQQLEDLMHAALFHDVGVLGGESLHENHGRGSAAILSDVRLMKGALPILAVLDSAGEPHESLPERTLVSAYVIARASEFDDEERARPHANKSSLVGARLYTSTRGNVDRVLRRLEARAREGRFKMSSTAAEDAW